MPSSSETDQPSISERLGAAARREARQGSRLSKIARWERPPAIRNQRFDVLAATMLAHTERIRDEKVDFCASNCGGPVIPESVLRGSALQRESETVLTKSGTKSLRDAQFGRRH
jgi:hypothetical protein